MLKQCEQGVELAVYIQPKAKKTELVGEHDGQLKIKVQAPPLDGKANAEVVEFLSTLIGISKSRVELLNGQKSRRKKILIHGLSIEEVRRKIAL